MKKSSIIKSYIYNLIYQIVNILFPLITIPYISRILNVENIGIYSYTLSIVTYFILFGSLGINLYAEREISYNRDNNISKIFWEIFILKITTLTMSLLIYYYLFCQNNIYNIYYKILLIEIISNMFDISWFYQGIENFKKIALKNIFIKIISTIFIFIYVNDNNDLNIYMFIIVLSNLIGNLLLWLNIFKYIDIKEIKNIKIFKNFKIILLFFIPQIACYVYNVLDKTMLGFIIGNKSEVGFYEQADKIIKMVITISTTLALVIMPRMAYYYSNNAKDKIKEYIFKSIKFILFLSIPMMFGLLSISSRFVTLFFGNGYEKVSILLNILSILIILVSISRIIGSGYLVPTNKMREYSLSVIIGAIINFCLNLILIRYYGSIGACISTIIGEFIVTLIQLLSLKDIISIKSIIIGSYKYLIISIIMFTINLIISNYIDNSLLCIIIEIVVSIIIYIGLLCLLNSNIFKKNNKNSIDI